MSSRFRLPDFPTLRKAAERQIEKLSANEKPSDRERPAAISEPAPPRPSPLDGVSERMVSLVEALRDAEVGVSPSQVIDAGQAMSVIDLLDREQLREALAATLLQRSEHRRIFDGLFELWFPEREGLGEGGDDAVELPLDAEGEIVQAALNDMLAELMADDSPQAQRRLGQLVAAIVDRLGRYQSSRGDSFSAYQATRRLQLDGLVERLVHGLLVGAGDPGGSSRSIAEADARQRVARLEDEIRQETSRRVAEVQGRQRVATYSVRPPLSVLNVQQATNAELMVMRREIVTLARLLANRLAQPRRAGAGQRIDLRKTLHRAHATAGVPVKLVQKKPRPKRPDLVVLCDVSGSVASFSQFTLLLVHALRERFSRVRAFAFVDRIDEITQLFVESADLAEMVRRALTEADVAGPSGHSDYGRAFGLFIERFEDSLTRNTSLLILGDGRTNYLDPNLDALREITSKVKHAHWLNPESEKGWGSGDSEADRYQSVLPMHECRNGRQLAEFIGKLLLANK
ncbi:MAG: vWA domain-containing protein [Segniliparus sp.]|uniref:vWA domain-containing protein n=1 Tax=Segniliparus sp. TaxID=2804064 RepID=UPI003F2AF117